MHRRRESLWRLSCLAGTHEKLIETIGRRCEMILLQIDVLNGAFYTKILEELARTHKDSLILNMTFVQCSIIKPSFCIFKSCQKCIATVSMKKRTGFAKLLARNPKTMQHRHSIFFSWIDGNNFNHGWFGILSIQRALVYQF